jgi:Tfp pilus assembly protein PilP
MTTKPLAWEDREFIDSSGAIERWYIEFFDGHAYNCKRVIFHSVDAMERAMVAMQRSVDLIDSDPRASEEAIEAAAAEQLRLTGTFHTADTAMAFFVDGREQGSTLGP